MDWTYLFQGPLTFPYRLIFELCLYMRLNGQPFHYTLCCKAMRCIAPLVPDDSSPLCIYFTVLYLLVCLGVLWFTWTFPRELSAFWRQTVCSPLWCLCRELIPQEQLCWEQILINERMLLVFYLMCHISVNLSIWFSPFFLCLAVATLLSPAVGWPFGDPQHRAKPALTSDVQSI